MQRGTGWTEASTVLALVPLGSLACVLAAAGRRGRWAGPLLELGLVVLPAGCFWLPAARTVCCLAAALVAAAAAAAAQPGPTSCPAWSGRLRWGALWPRRGACADRLLTRAQVRAGL